MRPTYQRFFTFAMRFRSCCILVAVGFIGIPAAAQIPVVTNVVNALSIDSMLLYVGELSGETTVDVGNGPVSIVSRHKLAPGNAIAADYLEQRLAALGYSPIVQTFSGGTGENIIAVKTGTLYPDRKVVLCAHYDAMPGGPVAAPAADDDGSGVAAVLEIARLVKDIEFENTIVFALWDEEEQGKIGSLYYAGIAAANDDTITAAVNMDAIAWDGNGDELMRIHTRPVANSLAIKDTAVMVDALYGIGNNIAINDPGATYSDHASFWTEGFGAILIIEDFDNDGNPHYHTPTDLLQYLVPAYYAKLARMSAATLMHLAVPANPFAHVSDGPSPSTWLKAFPSVTAGPLRVQLVLKRNETTRILLLNSTGGMERVLFTGTLPAGGNMLDVDLSDLAAGTYLLALYASDGMVTTQRVCVQK